MIRFFKTPFFIPKLFPDLIFHQSRNEKKIYLTFDDGPIPEITPFVLSALEKHKAKATFFCIGDNIRKHPEIFAQILSANHSIGNHTFHHLNGKNTTQKLYFDDILSCKNALINNNYISDNQLFRPPYGAIKKTQSIKLKQEYKIIFWDVLTYDFDKNLSPEKCLEKAIKHTINGSIVVFHDSFKAEKNLKYVLPRFLNHFSEKGFEFEAIH